MTLEGRAKEAEKLISVFYEVIFQDAPTLNQSFLGKKVDFLITKQFSKSSHDNLMSFSPGASELLLALSTLKLPPPS